MDSSPQEDAEGRAIVRVLAVVLERLVSANSHLAASDQEETKFHALRAPAIGILQYLERIHKYASCSKECFILALIYIDRLIQRNGFLLTDLNVHRVVITAVLLAAKFFDDAYYNNAYYAKVGGVLVGEMNALEVEFLFKIDFGLRVLPEVFDKYRGELAAHASVGGVERIKGCTDDELYGRQGQGQGRNGIKSNETLASQVQAPMLQTYSQADLSDPVMADPVVYNPTPVAAVAAPLMQEQHYPIQALQSSLTASVQPQVQAVGQGIGQGIGQGANQGLGGIPFPKLAAQVSAQQQPIAHPARGPSELDLVYHNITPAAVPQQPPVSRYAAPQDSAMQFSARDFVSPQPYASQKQQFPTNQGAGLGQQFPLQTTPARAQQAAPTMDLGYYSAPAAACANAMAQPAYAAPSLQTQPPIGQPPIGQPARAPALQRLPSYPEITPSPPPPSHMDIQGAPIIGPPTIDAYCPLGEGRLGCASQAQVGHIGGGAYLNPSSANATSALHAHIQGGMYPSNAGLQASTQLHPIGMASGHGGPGGWPIAIERRVTEGSTYS